jgi:hypothetical protein
MCVAMNYLTKWPECTALPVKEAAGVCDFIVNELCYRFGVPQAIITDQGREFVNKLNDRLCVALGISRRITSALGVKPENGKKTAILRTHE